MGYVDMDGNEHYDVTLTEARARKLRELADAAGVPPCDVLVFIINSVLDEEEDCGD